jgi:hypothetical protein
MSSAQLVVGPAYVHSREFALEPSDTIDITTLRPTPDSPVATTHTLSPFPPFHALRIASVMASAAVLVFLGALSKKCWTSGWSSEGRPTTPSSLRASSPAYQHILFLSLSLSFRVSHLGFDKAEGQLTYPLSPWIVSAAASSYSPPPMGVGAPRWRGMSLGARRAASSLAAFRVVFSREELPLTCASERQQRDEGEAGDVTSVCVA